MRFDRQRLRAASAAALLLATACFDHEAAAPGPLVARLGLAAVVTGETEAIEVTISYTRRVGGKVELARERFDVAGQSGEQEFPLTVNIGPCLADPDRTVPSTEGACVLVADIALLNAEGAPIASTELDAVEALPGEDTELPAFQLVPPLGVCSTPMTGVVRTYATIAEAVSNSLPGASINVCAGTHAVGTVVIDRPVSMRGPATGSAAQVVVSGSGSRGLEVNGVASGLVSFRDLEIAVDGASGAIHGILAQGVYDQVVVDRMAFSVTGTSLARGVTAYESTVSGARVTITSSSFTGGDVAVIALPSGSTGQAGPHVDVIGNQFSTFSFGGIQYQNGATGTIENNSLAACGLIGCIRVFASPNAVIRGNTVTLDAARNAHFGISVVGGGTATVEDNVVQGVGSAGAPADTSSYAIERGGIFIGHTAPSTVGTTSAVVTGNTISGAARGIRVSGGGVTVTGSANIISNVHTALEVTNTSATPSSLTIPGNQVTSYVVPIGFAGVSISPNTLQSTCTWWGSAAGPVNPRPGTPSTMYTPWEASGAVAYPGPCAGTIPLLATLSCSQEAGTISTGSNTVTSVEFINDSPRTVRVYWLDWWGQRILYNTLVPGQAYVQGTYPTHPWLLTDVHDQCLSLHVPVTTHTRVISKVTGGLTITSPSALPDGTIGVPYNHQFLALGGTGNYAWSLASGALPAGLTLGAGGLLSGTPTDSGTFDFTVGVTSGTETAQIQVRLIVSSAQQPPVVNTEPPLQVTATSATLRGAVVQDGQPYNVWFEWGTSPTLATFTATPSSAGPPGVCPGTTTCFWTIPITGLQQGTAYFYRIVSDNEMGTTRGNIRAFATGLAPVISGLTTAVETLNTPGCTFPGPIIGSLFRHTFSYSDGNGDVAAGGAAVAGTWTFQPSGNTGSIDGSGASFTGNGANGTVTLFLCWYFANDSSFTYSITLRDAAGNVSNTLAATVTRPAGANRVGTQSFGPIVTRDAAAARTLGGGARERGPLVPVPSPSPLPPPND